MRELYNGPNFNLNVTNEQCLNDVCSFSAQNKKFRLYHEIDNVITPNCNTMYIISDQIEFYDYQSFICVQNSSILTIDVSQKTQELKILSNFTLEETQFYQSEYIDNMDCLIVLALSTTNQVVLNSLIQYHFFQYRQGSIIWVGMGTQENPPSSYPQSFTLDS